MLARHISPCVLCQRLHSYYKARSREGLTASTTTVTAQGNAGDSCPVFGWGGDEVAHYISGYGTERPHSAVLAASVTAGTSLS